MALPESNTIDADDGLKRLELRFSSRFGATLPPKNIPQNKAENAVYARLRA